MAKRYNVSLPDSLVARIENRSLPMSALLQAAIYRYLDEEESGDNGKSELERRLERVERVLGLD